MPTSIQPGSRGRISAIGFTALIALAAFGLISRADAALYEAKTAGRNRVKLAA